MMNKDMNGLLEDLKQMPIDIFNALMVFMPMSNQNHRQLLILVNPGRVVGCHNSSNSSTPTMLLLDPCQSKSNIDVTVLANRVRRWLNCIYQSRSEGLVSMKFTSDNFCIHTPTGGFFMNLYTCSKSYLYHTKSEIPYFISPVPQQPSSIDNGVYIVKYMASMLLTREHIFSRSLETEELLMYIITGDAFKFTPLDIWRMRSEIYLFIERLSQMYSHRQINSQASIEDSDANAAMNAESTESNDINGESCSTALPALLDYSFLSNIIEVGDVVDYRLREPVSTSSDSNLAKRASVVAIRLVNDNLNTSDEFAPPPMTVLLNNGDRIVDALHLVRRVSMRNIYTNEPMWNPVRVWRELRSMYMYPTESNTTGVMYTETNIEPRCQAGLVSGGVEPHTNNTSPNDCNVNSSEMDHPNAIPIHSTSQTANRMISTKAYKRWSEKLDAIPSGDLGSFLPWLKNPKDIEAEIKYLNQTYKSFMEMGDPAGFETLVSMRTKDEYIAEKKLVAKRIADRRKKGRPILKILWPLCYVSWFVSLFSGTSQTIVVDESYDTKQTVREFKRDEGILQFERQTSMLRIQYCPCCRENHLNHIKHEPKEATPYKCDRCKKLDDECHYLKKNLHPVWYERKEGAKSHKDFKFDSNGNKIARYDIPKQLSVLTMSEQLLIRRCAPYIPSLHLSTGFYGIKGHCVAFPQDITEMCDILPQRPESLVTFIRQMGNKNTSEMHLKHLKVRKNKVLAALEWLRLHHSGYHDIKIDKSKLDWIGNKNTASIKVDQCHVTVDQGKATTRQQFVSGVQCVGDFQSADDISFSTMAMSDVHTVPNTLQSKPILELADVARETKQTDKLVKFPMHGDTPVR